MHVYPLWHFKLHNLFYFLHGVIVFSVRCITIACSIFFSEIFIDGMAATNTWHHNFQIVTSSFVFGNFTLSGLIIWKACISEYLFQSFFLSVILFFYWADIDEEKSTTASISVNGTYPSLFVPRPQTLALHYIWYIITDSIRSSCITFSTTRSSVTLLYLSISCSEDYFFFSFW